MSVYDILSTICAVGSGVVAGVFFAFSTSVMAALGRLPAAQGIAAMQTINVVIINPLFLTFFMGTAVACVAAVFVCISFEQGNRLSWTLTASALYVVGSFLVTMWFNVPRNNVLARLNALSPDAEVVWRDYLVTWTRWNHVRTLASLAASAVFTLQAFFR